MGHKRSKRRKKEYAPCAADIERRCGGRGVLCLMHRIRTLECFPELQVPGVLYHSDSRHVHVMHGARKCLSFRVSVPHGDAATLLCLLSHAMFQYGAVEHRIRALYAAEGCTEGVIWPSMEAYENINNIRCDDLSLKYDMMCVVTALSPLQQAIFRTVVCDHQVSPLRAAIRGYGTGACRWDITAETPPDTLVLTPDGVSGHLVQRCQGDIAVVRATTHISNRLRTCLVSLHCACDLVTEQEPHPSRPPRERALENFYKSLIYISPRHPCKIATTTTEGIVRGAWMCVYPCAVIRSGECSWRIANGEYVSVQEVRSLMQVAHDPGCIDFARWRRQTYPEERLVAVAALSREFVLMCYPSDTPGRSWLMLRSAAPSQKWRRVCLEIHDRLIVLRVVASDGESSYVACVGPTQVHLVFVRHSFDRIIRVVSVCSVRDGIPVDCTVFRRRLCMPAAGGAVQVLDYSHDVVFSDARGLVLEYAQSNGMRDVPLPRVLQVARETDALVPYHEVQHVDGGGVRGYVARAWPDAPGVFECITAHSASRMMYASVGSVIFTSIIQEDAAGLLNLEPSLIIPITSFPVTCLLSGGSHIFCAAGTNVSTWLIFPPGPSGSTLSAEIVECADGVAGASSSFHDLLGVVTVTPGTSSLYQPERRRPVRVGHTLNPVAASGSAESQLREEVRTIGANIEDSYRHYNTHGEVRLSACQELKCHATAMAQIEMQKGGVFLIEKSTPTQLGHALRSWQSGERPLLASRQLRDGKVTTPQRLLSSSSYVLLDNEHVLTPQDSDMLLVLYPREGVVEVTPHEARSWIPTGEETGSLVIIRRSTAGVPPLLSGDIDSRTWLQRSPAAQAPWAWANVKVCYVVDADGMLHAYLDASESTVWHLNTHFATELVVQPTGAVSEEVYMEYGAPAALSGGTNTTSSGSESFDSEVVHWARNKAVTTLGTGEITWHGRQESAPFASEWCDLETVGDEAIRRMREKLGTEGPSVMSTRFVLPHNADVIAQAPGLTLAQQRHARMMWALDGAPPDLRATATGLCVPGKMPLPTAVAPEESIATWEKVTMQRIMATPRVINPPPLDERNNIAMLRMALATDEATVASDAQDRLQQLRLSVRQDVLWVGSHGGDGCKLDSVHHRDAPPVDPRNVLHLIQH